MKSKSKSSKRIRKNTSSSNGVNTILIAIILVAIFSFMNIETLEAKAEDGAMSDYAENREILWLARIIYSETKKADEQVLVAWVARNRVETTYRGENTYHGVAIDKGQFSGLNPSDAQYLHNISRNYESGGESWKKALEIAEAVYSSPGYLRPFPKTVRHFYSPKSVRVAPGWSVGHKPVVTVKERTPEGANVRFAFYDGVR